MVKQALKNKWILGGLTVGDLVKISTIEEFCFGKHWCPVTVLENKNNIYFFVSKTGGFLAYEADLQQLGNSDLTIPADRKVKLVGCIARFEVEPREALLSFQGEVSVKIARHPF
jgi:hypothetical protein